MSRQLLTISTLIVLTCAWLAPDAAGAEKKVKDRLTGMFKRDKDNDVIERPDLSGIFASRATEQLLGEFGNEDKRLKVEDKWIALLQSHSQTALQYNQQHLYANPNIQAFVNNLGQNLVPREADSEAIVTFKILIDPVPEVYALATGTVFITTGFLAMIENESQLAFVLAHEAGHILANHHLADIVDAQKREDRGRAAGIVLDVLGAATDATDLERFGAALVYDIISLRGRVKFSERLEKEADAIALELSLRHQYDIRDSQALLAELGRISRNSSPEVGLSFASNPRILELRQEHLGAHLESAFRPGIDAVLNGEGFKLASPRYNQLMSEVKRDNGLMALERDLFAIAKANLESAADIRTDDPVTMYGLGILYRAIARSPEDRYKAARYFRDAVQFDSGRHQFPEAHLQYAVELVNMDDPSVYRDIQYHLKTYVTLYQRLHSGELPREMRFVYDYLEMAGEKSWVAIPVQNISSGFPYQYTGDPSIDTLEDSPLRSGR